jgi:hypothetical protein
MIAGNERVGKFLMALAVVLAILIFLLFFAWSRGERKLQGKLDLLSLRSQGN